MNALQILVPLFGVLLGGLLSGITAQLRARNERKRVIASALADLLEVRHRLLAANLFIGKIAEIVDLKHEQRPHFRNAIDAMAPQDKALDERYSNAISLLAGVDPILAFDLRSKNELPRLISLLRSATPAGTVDFSWLESFESTLIAAVKPILDKAVLKLAYAHSFFTWFRIRRLLRQDDDAPPEATEFLNTMAKLLTPTKDATAVASGPSL